jgi:hypothetical protein
MRSCFVGSLVVLVLVLAFTSVALAQTAQQSGASKSQAAKTPPFDPHDLSGVWQIRCGAGCTLSSSGGRQPNVTPPMTPWGQAKFDAAKPGIGPRQQPLGNDPMMICDPLGVPRILLYPATPVEVVQIPGRVVEFFEWYHTWREIWTDGRELPKDPDPAWFGYSVGKWDGGTFIIDSAGFNDRTWLDQLGDPHSDAMRLQERYRRVDHDTLELNMTLTDPKAYTKPWVSETKISKLVPRTQFWEASFCAPSDEEQYKEEMRDPAAKTSK